MFVTSGPKTYVLGNVNYSAGRRLKYTADPWDANTALQCNYVWHNNTAKRS